MIVDKESADLDALYKRHQIESGDKATATPSASSPASSLDSTDGPTVLASDQEPRSPAKPELPPYNQLLICADDVTTLEKVYALRPSEVIDIERAIEQADHRASEAEKVLRLQAEGAAKK
jgi:hypothetical protein